MVRWDNLIKWLIILICLVVVALVIRNCKTVPEGKVLVDQSSVDSLRAYVRLADSIQKLLELPPDTIKVTDTVYLGELVTVISTPEVEVNPEDSSLIYSDSLIVEDEISAWIDITMRGYVNNLSVKWRYKPVIKEIETVIEKPVYHPVIETIPEPFPVTGHYLSAVAGGNDKLFTFGIDYDLVKTRNIYGVQYRRWGDQNVFGVKIGINLNSLFKKRP